jgi:hypothetical protein
MDNQSDRRGWGVLTLIVPWGIVGMVVNLTQDRASPAMIWVWAAAASIASTIAISLALKFFRRAAR